MSMTPARVPNHRPGARIRMLVTVLLLVAGAPVVATSQPASAAAQAIDLVLRPGDALKLSVWRAPEFDGEFAVLPDGSLAHPFLRDIVVAGLPMSQVRELLERRAKTQNEYAQVSVQPLLRITVGGQVMSPSLYRHPAGTSIAEALILAGGPTPLADLKKVSLIRDGRTTFLDLSEPTGIATRTAVASGDQLLLPRRRDISWRAFVVPLVSVVGAAFTVLNFLIVRAQQQDS